MSLFTQTYFSSCFFPLKKDHRDRAVVGPALKSQVGPGDPDVSLSPAAGCRGGPPHHTSSVGSVTWGREAHGSQRVSAQPHSSLSPNALLQEDESSRMRSLRREFTTGEEELFLQRGKGLPMLRLSTGPGATLGKKDGQVAVGCGRFPVGTLRLNPTG